MPDVTPDSIFQLASGFMAQARPYIAVGDIPHTTAEIAQIDNRDEGCQVSGLLAIAMFAQSE
ncbi:MAG: hypothetical protein NVSMB42_04660 [Herpetosiphon sp.]